MRAWVAAGYVEFLSGKGLGTYFKGFSILAVSLAVMKALMVSAGSVPWMTAWARPAVA